MKVYFKILGCERRSLEAERLKKFFISNGCELIFDPSGADVIIYSSCGFDGVKEDASLIDIKYLNQFSKSKLIIVGCLPAINKERLKEIFDGPVFTPENIDDLQSIFPEFNVKLNEIKYFNTFTYHINGKIIPSIERASSPLNVKNLYHICISRGCDRRCTYCGEWPAWGSYKSKPVKQCINEFKEGLSAGFHEFNILADSIGPYGIDINYSLPQLLSDFIKNKGNYSIHLSEYNLLWIHKQINQLIPLLATKRIKSILCAIQSGSDRILGLMQRGYSSGEAISDLLRLKQAYSEIALHTQIIIGFPTENEKDFQQTLDTIEKIKFASISLYSFNAKPGTPAYEINSKVSEDVKKQRAQSVLDLCNRINTLVYYYG